MLRHNSRQVTVSGGRIRYGGSRVRHPLNSWHRERQHLNADSVLIHLWYAPLSEIAKAAFPISQYRAVYRNGRIAGLRDHFQPIHREGFFKRNDLHSDVLIEIS